MESFDDNETEVKGEPSKTKKSVQIQDDMTEIQSQRTASQRTRTTSVRSKSVRSKRSLKAKKPHVQTKLEK